MTLTNEQARESLLNTYTKRCVRIANENSEDHELFDGYTRNIAMAQSCKTFEELLGQIRIDGDFNDDPDEVIELIMQSLIE